MRVSVFVGMRAGQGQLEGLSSGTHHENQVDLELTETPSFTYCVLEEEENQLLQARLWFAPEVTVCNSHPRRSNTHMMSSHTCRQNTQTHKIKTKIRKHFLKERKKRKSVLLAGGCAGRGCPQSSGTRGAGQATGY